MKSSSSRVSNVTTSVNKKVESLVSFPESGKVGNTFDYESELFCDISMDMVENQKQKKFSFF